MARRIGAFIMRYDNGETLAAIQNERKVITDRAKELALARRNACKYTVDFIPVLQGRLDQYVEDMKRQGKPLTISGGVLASGVPDRTWYDMKDGKLDHILDEYLLLHDGELPETLEETTFLTFSQIIKRFYLQVAEQRETACASLRGNPAGNIFLLKAQHGFREEETPQHLTQALVIADGEQARKALELLK